MKKEGKVILAIIRYLLKMTIIPVFLFLMISFIGENFNVRVHIDLYRGYVYDYCKSHVIESAFIIWLGAYILRPYICELVKLIKANKYNKLDKSIAQIFILSIFIYIKYKTVDIVWFVFNDLILFIRCIRLSITDKNNTVWLSDICNGNIKNKKEGKRIYIKEDVPDVDLLDRDNEVNSLFHAIENCYPQKTFFIGLDGKWNTGKSTIIKFTKEKLNKIDRLTIVDFDPCKYETCDAMLAGFYNEIAIKLNIYHKIKYRRALKLLLENLSMDSSFKLDYKKIILECLHNFDINKMIRDELDITNNRLLIIVENLDRADKDVMNFFIRCTYAVTDFKNTIFLLVYDSNLLNKQLSKIYKTDNMFMKKIINLPIKISKTNKSKVEEIYNDALRVLVEREYIPNRSYNRFTTVDFYEDLRDVIRSLNFLIGHADIIEKLDLDIYDLIKINYIHEHNPVLYDEIYENSDWITYRTNSESNSIEAEEIIEKLKKISNLAKKNDCQKLLCDLFENINLIDELESDKQFFKNAEDIRCIDNPYYVRMYFHLNESMYYSCENKIKKMTDKLLNCNDITVYEMNLKNEILEQKILRATYSSTILLNILNKNEQENNIYMYYSACKQLIVKNGVVFSYLTKLFVNLFGLLGTDEYEREIETMKNNYPILWVHNLIVNNSTISDRTKEVDKIIEKVCKDVCTQEINLLDWEKYDRKNMDVLYEHIDAFKVEKLLLKHLNKKTIVNYIRLYMEEDSDEDEYSYKFKIVEPGKKKIKKILKEINEDKIEIESKKIIQAYKESEKNKNHIYKSEEKLA